MGERLCQACVEEGLKKCWFKTTVRDEIKALPSSKNQIPIVEGTTITQEAFAVHEKIAKVRVAARDQRLCPWVNYTPRDPKFLKHL